MRVADRCKCRWNGESAVTEACKGGPWSFDSLDESVSARERLGCTPPRTCTEEAWERHLMDKTLDDAEKPFAPCRPNVGDGCSETRHQDNRVRT